MRPRIVRGPGRVRERCLITKEGWVLTQDDPLPHAVEAVYIQIAGEERRFVYDITTTERDEVGRLKEVAIYRELKEGEVEP
jgi:hypothetical protein